MTDKKFIPNKTDLILSGTTALLFPFLAGFLYSHTGALLPMILYYGLAWGLSIFRRGETGYHLKNLKRPPVAFYVNLGLIFFSLVFGYMSRIKVQNFSLAGVILTGVFWALINASSEQLLWLYIFDSWDLYGKYHLKKAGRNIMMAVGLILFSCFIGVIHTFFWIQFLETVDASVKVGILFVIGTSISGYLHIIVWRKSGEMFYTFIPHFLLNLIPLFWTGYSILPYLIA